MRNGFPGWLLLLILAIAGCRRSDLVETELRARDVQYREALEELMRQEAISDDLRRENEALRAGGNLTPEEAALTFGVRKISIGRGTAGIDNDRIPGDEALQVWIEPRDAGDRVVKVPGALQIAVLEINPRGEKSLLSTWEFSPEQLSSCWRQGLLSMGYAVDLLWKVPPRTETIRVVARFTLPDGRSFEADRDLKIRLLPGAASRPASPACDTPIFRSTPAFHSVAPVGNWTPADAPSTIRPAGNWQPVSLEDVVDLARPFPVRKTPTAGFFRSLGD